MFQHLLKSTFIVLIRTNANQPGTYLEKLLKYQNHYNNNFVGAFQNKCLIKNAEKMKARLNLNEIKPQSNIFNFVDAVFYKQREKAYQELSKLTKDQVSPYEILSMMYYGLRTLAQAKTDSPSYKKLHPFVKGKAQTQSKNFTLEQLLDVYEKFRKIDMKSKLSEIDEDMLIPMIVETILNS